MDSVLSGMIDNSKNSVVDLHRELHKLLGLDHLFLFRNINNALLTLISALGIETGDVILSPLAPLYQLEIVEYLGLTPVICDVDHETALFDIDLLQKKVNARTVLIIDTIFYDPDSKVLENIDSIPVITIFMSGIVEGNNSEIVTGIGRYNIFSLEDDALINSMGGAALTLTEENAGFVTDKLHDNPDFALHSLNASLTVSQLDDIKHYFDKQRRMTELYRTSLLKSHYTTFGSEDYTTGNYFPVILKKSLKEISSYCGKHGVKTVKAFRNSIVKNSDFKAPKASGLSSRTLLFPHSLSLSSDSIELILKLLSTLP